MKSFSSQNRFAAQLLLAVLAFFPIRAGAEGLRPSMDKAYENFKELQVYMRNASSFSNPQNSAAISANLEALLRNFHGLAEVRSPYKNEPGFLTSLKLVTEMLKDATNRFNENKKDYAFWRLRTLSNYCVNCHVTYNATAAFADSGTVPQGLSEIQKVDFYLATRQLEEARRTLAKALTTSQSDYLKMALLRRWLVVEVRSVGKPADTYVNLSALSSKLQLPRAEAGEVGQWTASLKKWAEEKPSAKDLSTAERILKASLSGDYFSQQVDSVGLLRSTALLHAVLAQPGLKSADRARTLYLLGLGYSQLSLFLIDELPEMYLEACIVEFPGTPQAREAFDLYEQVMTARFSGSGGVYLPSDAEAHLSELHDKAYGIPSFNGKI
ncbi:MAG: hypothetical protein J0M12_18155 [Deltaproteobacteria bacterium]|nr:hypothetical protein [Deltaproteobacteria bacterium]